MGADAEESLSKKEAKQLQQWLNPNYLTPQAIKDINEQVYMY
jgi:hypothetical protein